MRSSFDKTSPFLTATIKLISPCSLSRGDRLDVLADDLLGAKPDKGAQTEKKNQQIIDLTEPD